MRWMLALIALVSVAHAHGWYDPACCSEQDCYPVPRDQVEVTPRGYKVNGDYVPFGAAKASADANFHVCMYAGRVLCFYAPRGTS